MNRLMILVLFLINLNSNIFSEEISFTTSDRDRMIRVEEGIKSVQRQLDESKTFQLWGFGILFTFMLGLVGFVLWDRRSFIKPLENDFLELKEREAKLEKILKEFALKEPKLAHILKSTHLL